MRTNPLVNKLFIESKGVFNLSTLCILTMETTRKQTSGDSRVSMKSDINVINEHDATKVKKQNNIGPLIGPLCKPA